MSHWTASIAVAIASTLLCGCSPAKRACSKMESFLAPAGYPWTPQGHTDGHGHWSPGDMDKCISDLENDEKLHPGVTACYAAAESFQQLTACGARR